ncbi:MAG: PAS domain S-box protein [Chitinophagaceae bacterium]|nr:PAS domain S-box protein [Chitinophagaceae bacterium]
MPPPQKLKKNKIPSDDISNSIDRPVLILDKNLKSVAFNDRAASTFKSVYNVADFTRLLSSSDSRNFLTACKAVVSKRKEQRISLTVAKKIWNVKAFAGQDKNVVLLFEPAEESKSPDLGYLPLLESMGDAFLVTDENFKIVYVNSVFCKRIGIAKEKLLGTDALRFDKNLTRAQLKAFYNKALKKSILYDTIGSDNHGDPIDIEVHLFTVKWHGKTHYGSVRRDISLYKKAQEELKNNHERFKRITNVSTDALWEISLANDESWCNDVYKQMFGLKRNDITPSISEWQKRISPEDFNDVMESFKKAIKNKDTFWSGEYWFKNHKNKWVYILDRRWLTYSKGGKAERMLTGMVDITELKNTQTQLATQHNLSQSIIDSLPGIFYLINKDHDIIRWNKNFEIITGYSEDDIRTMKPHNFVPQNDSELLYEKIKEAFKKGWAEMEALLENKSGQRTPFYLSVKRTVIDGKKYLIGAGMDTSEMKKAQRKLRKMQSEIAEQKLNAQKEISRAFIEAQEKERNFIGRELHDNVNQLLAGARLYLTMGIRNHEGFDEVARYPIELIDSGIQEIRALTHRSISPSKDLSLEQLVLGIVDMLNAAGINSTLDFNLNIEMLDNYRTNIYRILQEASTNIVRHSEAKNASIIMYEKDCKIHICISDDGKGFNLKQQKEGIGLLNINNRVDAYNGEFSIESKPKKGCIITITLPVPDCSQRKKTSTTQKKSKRKK